MIAGIILAAGASSRMGSPKALLDYRGESFIGRLVRVISSVCDPVIVVLGYHADAIRPAIKGAASTVINPAPERGQISSLQIALAALPDDVEGFLFTRRKAAARTDSKPRSVLAPRLSTGVAKKQFARTGLIICGH